MEHSSKRVALVTGSAKRIGAQLVRRLHAEGLRVILHYNGSEQAAQTIADELNSIRKDSVTIIQFNLLDLDQLDTFAVKILAIWGRLDILINNASTFYPTPMQDISIDQWHNLIGVNLQAPLFLTKALAPTLAIHKGCIINIVDIHSERPLKGYTIYCIAKAGLAMLTKSLARELAPDVRVNGVSPGAIMWPEVKDYEPMHQDIIERTALKREGDPTDIADTVWFLINSANYITGQIIAVDGGRTLSN
jgi:pteridine reductase|tara:strand:- start:265 stop:1008 length:744 start_codon:yes stop_codon:yes gene_type:complete